MLELAKHTPNIQMNTGIVLAIFVSINCFTTRILVSLNGPKGHIPLSKNSPHDLGTLQIKQPLHYVFLRVKELNMNSEGWI